MMAIRRAALAIAGLVCGLMVTIGSPTPAQAADCVPLDAAALAFGSAELVPDDGCYELPSVAGDVLLMTSTGPLTVIDANGDQQCAVAAYETLRCELTGVAPFQTSSGHSRLRIAGLDDPTGCGTFTPSPFGGPGAGPLGVTLEYGAFGCQTGAVPAGVSRMLVTDYAYWAWYDPAGTELCGGTLTDTCTLVDPTQVTVVFSQGQGAEVAGAVVPLSQTNGCVDVSTSWATTATSVGGATPQMDCLSFSAAAGQRVFPAVEQTWEIPGEAEIVDADGTVACTTAPGFLGCRLTGSPPYRLLTWGPIETYHAAVRDITDMTGCPALRPSPFGVEPTDVHPGIGCRRLMPSRTGAYVVKPNAAWEREILGADGALLCSDDTWTCRLSGGEPQYLVTGPLGLSFRTAFHRLGGAGCSETLTAGVAGQWDGHMTPRQVDCVRLAYPSGARVSLLPPSDYRAPMVDIVDSTGALRCRLGAFTPACTLQGSAPFRALAWDEYSRDYHLAFPRLDRPTGCSRLKVGAWGTTAGNVLRLPKGRIAGCVSARKALLAGYSFVGYQRLRGSSDTVVTALTSNNGCDVDGEAQRGIHECVLMPPLRSPVSILVSTDGSGGRWKVVARGLTQDQGCRQASGREVRSAATEGRLASPLQFDCIDLPAAAADQVVTRVDDRGIGATLRVHPSGGLDPVCATVYDSFCRLTGFDGYRMVVTRESYAARAVPYVVSPVRTRTGPTWSGRCRRFADYTEGFGPVTGTLSPRHSVDCILVEDDGYDAYRVVVKATDGSGEQVVPVKVASSDNIWPGECSQIKAGTFQCGDFTEEGPDEGGHGLLLIYRPSGVRTLSYRLVATCLTAPCGLS